MASVSYTNESLDQFTLGDSEDSFLTLTWEQELPYPGKRGLAGDAARRDSEAAAHEVDQRELEVLSEVKQAYADYEFHLAYHATIEFCAVELSALYFDIVKDRLYTWRRDGRGRRSAQTVLWAVAGDLLRMLAPVLSFTASEAWASLPGAPAGSVFLAGFPERPRPAGADALEARYARLFEVRAVVQKALEEARQAKRIGSGLEALVQLQAEGETLDLLESARDELPALLIVSKVELSLGHLRALVAPAPGRKCPRCWVYAEDQGASPEHPQLCGKCASALA
jgi:isoleucyl-tRNA synthetase